MNKLIILIASIISVSAAAQETVLPAPPQKTVIVIKNATIHTGTGKVIENGVIRMKDGKIEAVGAAGTVSEEGAQVVEARGKHVYPGLILPVSSLGLVEISAVRATNDVQELGEFNPNVRSIVAYNSD